MPAVAGGGFEDEVKRLVVADVTISGINPPRGASKAVPSQLRVRMYLAMSMKPIRMSSLFRVCRNVNPVDRIG